LGSMGHTIFSGLGALIFWGVLALLLFVAVRATVSRIGPEAKTRDPVDILKRRYARGDIDKDEYDRTLKDLKDEA